MSKQFYKWTRDLHLYFGLFISPFILLFSVSVFFLNHAKIDTNKATSIETIRPLQIPEGLETAQGPAAIALAKTILPQVHADGEIGFARFVRATRHFVFPVSKPGLEATVDVDIDGRCASITRRIMSPWSSARRARRPRWMRDLTVPSDTPVRVAISS